MSSRPVAWLKSGIRAAAQNLMKGCVAFAGSRRLLNVAYLKLSPSQRRLFHGYFAKIFRGSRQQGSTGIWEIEFCGRTIQMPLRRETLWLDWDCAVAALGHDLEVVETYGALLRAPEAIDLFVDVGANYGTHSVLFLTQGIETISFEPNRSCHGYFHELCRLNGVFPELEAVALGEEPGAVELSYPEQDTWFGTLATELKARLRASHQLVSETVEQVMLDDYLARFQERKVLVKIDTEGSELAVLRGSVRMLKEAHPYIIFESLSPGERADMFCFFEDQNYRIFSLPWAPASRTVRLNREEFAMSSSTNFLAIPEARRARAR